MKGLISFLHLLVFVSFCGYVSAQQLNYQFRHINANQGLSHNQVTAFLKDRKGFLWIGTYSGLNRFDGYSIKVHVNDAADSTTLSNNTIARLFETPDGKLGVLTAGGVNLYDPETENFHTDLASFYKRFSLPEGNLVDIIKDQEKKYWFLTGNTGIVFYDNEKNTSIPIKHIQGNDLTISSDSVAAIAHDGKNGHWIIHSNGIIEKIIIKDSSYEVTYRNDFPYKVNNRGIYYYRMMADKDGDLWIFILNHPDGIYFFDAKAGSFQQFNQRSDKARLNTNLVSSIAQADDGTIWVGTDHGGVNIIDKKTFTTTYVTHRPEESKSIGQNSISPIYKDDDGILWLGTFKKGVSYYHENIIRFPLYRNYPLSQAGLPYGDVNRFAEDDLGNLWIGTNGGGLIYFDRTKNTFKQFTNDPKDPNSLSSNVIVSLCMDHQKRLWIGTYYGGLNLYDGKKFIRYTHNPAEPRSISDQNVWEIFEDSRKRLWVGTIQGGLDLFDPNVNGFSHYEQRDVNSVQSNYIAAIREDSEGNIWIGTNEGLDVLNRSQGRFFHYESNKNVKGGLSDNFVLDIHQSKDGHMWIATRNGLNLYNKESNNFTVWKDKDGLPHNSILTILEDNQGNLWFSTPNGLSNMLISEESKTDRVVSFRNYDEADGLQGKQFNENAAFKTRSGELIFGGSNGFNIFVPEKLGVNKKPPRVVLSDLQLYNRSIHAGEEVDGEVVLKKAISEVDEITFPPGQNVFSIEFAGLNFFNPEKTEYQYMLKGFHTTWLKADARSRRVTFTNLDPGQYTFIVKAANNDGYWNEKGAEVKITVLPPFWKTRWAFLLYCASIVVALLITRKLIQYRERFKFEREQERQEAIRMHELDMMKIKFFTNVSHEFRTPLTLILTPIEKMISHAKEAEQKNQFQLIQRNAKRLLNLVNQLLDFRKLEVQEIKFNPSEGDIIHFIAETVYSFSDLSEKKDIRLEFKTSIASLETLFDQDKLEKILFNLLSNAFKFTPEHGAVTVAVTLEESETEKSLNIKVQDTGIGIAPEKQEKIFERFFQNELPKSLMNQGSGIGLSITKEFVKIHGGTIMVESQVGEGSCFTVKLPLNEVFSKTEAEISAVVGHPVEAEKNSTSKKPALLLVEDNEDFRFYLKDNLKSEYRIIEARNGQEGLQKALDTLPDLIVSDIMMPELNGIELCKKIRSDARLSHTPVILLTARSSEEQKLEGFDVGANDYITKPFNFEILLSRIRNLIIQRESYHKTFPGQLDVKATELKITSMDQKFIEKAIKCVEDHISEPEFSVEDLSHELGISRAHFYKKVLALTGKSPLEFIRTIRLQQAAQLLEKSQLTVAEVAYKVGFNNPKYFARYFREQYHMLPSAYASRRRKPSS